MVNRVLLTGAGFTANFGTPLSREISNIIFNDIGNSSVRLRNLLTNNFDYEAIYQSVMFSDEYTDEEKTLLNNSIRNAYTHIDKIVQENSFVQTNYDLFNDFIIRFSKPHGGSGYIFTLNQDLFIERRFINHPVVTSIELPAVRRITNNADFTYTFSLEDFEKRKAKYEAKKKDIYLSYIKLHGSSNWFEQDNSLMVIGSGKNEKIKTNPFLSWYFELFQKQLNIPETKLFIIGYSFNDTHINEAIINSKDKLRLYIINITPMADFFKDLRNKPFGNEFGELIEKYYPRSLNEIFVNTSSDLIEIKKNYFNLSEPFCN